MEILENISLAQCTTIRIGGPARFFCIVKNQEDLEVVFNFAKNKNLKIFLLGGGCNTIFPDSGIDGLIIKMNNTEFKNLGNGGFLVGAGAGLGYLAQETVKAGYSGAEWCAAVPGTVGGAIYGNAGAFGGEMKDIVEKAECIDLKSRIKNQELRIPPTRTLRRAGKNLVNNEWEFGYRDSVFKKHPEWIIWRAVIKLKKGDISDGQNKIKEYLEKKNSTQDLGGRSAGCAFKNPKLSNDQKFLKHLRDALELEKEDFEKITKTGHISAGFMIDRLGLKGKTIGGIKISEIHANFLINTGNATAEDVVIMLSLIKEKVRNHFDVQLQEEIQLIGFEPTS